MPPGGAQVHGEMLATIRRLAHEKFTSDAVGRALERLNGNRQRPAPQVGRAVLTADAHLFTGDAPALVRALAEGNLMFHAGRIGGALPQIRS